MKIHLMVQNEQKFPNFLVKKVTNVTGEECEEQNNY
ncbi:hypothetical protein NIES2100_03710 [Calothrix sp. NIES-2100]|nr:hypothetical protein NIES2100_03710 [Calothrix sp. NIES-2100]